MLKVYDPGIQVAQQNAVDATGVDLPRSIWNPAICAFLVSLGILFLTMPAFFYPGDNFTPRAEAAHLLMTGEFGIPLSRADELGEFVNPHDRGRYFVENYSQGRFFSKYGLTYTLLYLPPMAPSRRSVVDPSVRSSALITGASGARPMRTDISTVFCPGNHWGMT